MVQHGAFIIHHNHKLRAVKLTRFLRIGTNKPVIFSVALETLPVSPAMIGDAMLDANSYITIKNIVGFQNYKLAGGIK